MPDSSVESITRENLLSMCRDTWRFFKLNSQKSSVVDWRISKCKKSSLYMGSRMTRRRAASQLKLFDRLANRGTGKSFLREIRFIHSLRIKANLESFWMAENFNLNPPSCWCTRNLNIGGNGSSSKTFRVNLESIEQFTSSSIKWFISLDRNAKPKRWGEPRRGIV